MPVQALDDISPVSSEENYKTDDWEYEASFDSDVSGIQKNLETEKTRFLHGFDGQAHQSPSPTAIAKRARLVSPDRASCAESSPMKSIRVFQVGEAECDQLARKNQSRLARGGR